MIDDIVMRKSKFTEDMSVYEASAFWDEHDFFEFNDVQEIWGPDLIKTQLLTSAKLKQRAPLKDWTF